MALQKFHPRIFSYIMSCHGVVVTACCESKQTRLRMFLSMLSCLNFWMYFATDQLLVRWNVSGRAPVVKQLPWAPDKHVAAMCFDPTVSWLLVVTGSPCLYILPVLALMVRLLLSRIRISWYGKAAVVQN